MNPNVNLEPPLLDTFRLNESVKREVRVVQTVYRNEDNGYSVYDVEDNDYRRFKVTGYFPVPMKLDSYYMLTGTVKEGKYGRTLQVSEYKSRMPESEEGIIAILRTLPQLDTRAPIVYRALGPETLDLILNNPEEVAWRIKGVGLNLARSWQYALKNLKDTDIILQTLKEYQIPDKACKALLEKYPDIIERLTASPYFLAEEVRGFTFAKCDKIALENGYPINGQDRLQQAAMHILRQAGTVHGDCYLPLDEFLTELHRLVDVRVDFRVARSIVAGTKPSTVTVGNRELPVDKAALADAFNAWRASRTRQPFSYVCEAVSDADIRFALEALAAPSHIVIEDGKVYTGRLYRAEASLANSLAAMSASEYGGFTGLQEALEAVCKAEGVTLEAKQEEAVLRLCRGRGGVFVLNGRAGCGKTFTLNIIIKVLARLYEQMGLVFSAKIMAPTGKAAQVAHAATGLPANTVHKALHLVADGSMDDAASISGECVVIDEFSMMGLELAALLARSISPGTKVIIMGDFEQLPSIDPGSVLKDIIASQAVPVVTLDVVRRQAEGSGILYNANAILEGQTIRSKLVNDKGIKDNAYIYAGGEPHECGARIVGLLRNLRKQGLSMDNIQVLCPQKKTDVGIDALNYLIQAEVNPPRGGKELLSKMIVMHDDIGTEQTVELKFREGDKVVHTANDYEKRFYRFVKGEGFVENYDRVGIVNGETGRIARIVEHREGKSVHQRIFVKYGEDQYALYEDDWADLTMSYAMTIHRAQGSQWPVVIAPILFCNKSMLDRKLFYTLYTRAQMASFVFGTEEAIEYTVRNDKPSHRRTWLADRLRIACGKGT